MKLLFITRKIDTKDERVGFVTDWILEFAKKVDSLIIFCQEIGKLPNLPNNVEIYSWGKEKGYSRLRQFITLKLLVFKHIKKIDAVFTHMMPIYALIFGCTGKIFRKKVIHWHTHKNVPWQLKWSRLFVDEYISANKESFRMKTKKPVRVFGHGINIKNFQFSNSNFQTNSKFIILTVGRISPTKNIDTLIEIANLINLNYPELRDKILFQIIGAPALKTDEKYYLELIKTVKEKKLNNLIDFLGPLPYSEILNYYANCNLFINLSATGSVDKTVLEAMASKKLVLTSNEAFKNIVPESLFLENNNSELLLKKIQEIINLSAEQKTELQETLWQEVKDHHNLANLIQKIIELYKK